MSRSRAAVTGPSHGDGLIAPATTHAEGPGRRGRPSPSARPGPARDSALMKPQVRRAQVLAWRLSAHSLGERLPAARQAEAVRPAGLRTGGPDSALVGWHARAEGVGR